MAVAGLLALCAPGVAGAQGAPPVVDAGPDQVVTLPAVASLDGTVTSGELATVRWSLVSGPGPAEFADPTAEDTEVALAAPGTYVLRLNASDGVAAAGDDVTIVVVASNAPPTVSAGADQTVAIADAAALHGAVSDDGLPAPARLSVAWSLVGGPGTVSMPDSTSIRTSARFGAPGTYVLRMTATDGAATAADEVTITVTAPNARPRVSAGPSRSVEWPAAAVLAGTASDDGIPESPGTLSLAWSVVSGPGAVSFESPGRAETTVRFVVAGAYVLRLSGSDGAAEAHDDVTVVVAPPPASSGLLAAYGFDEGAGTTIPDRSGHAAHLTRHGATWVPSGRHGGAMAFDGVNDRLEGPALTLPATFTVMAWVLNTGGMPYETLVSVGAGRALKLGFEDVLFTLPGGDVPLGPGGGGEVWHHVAVTSDGTALRTFVDGGAVGPPRPRVIEPFAGALLVGAWPLGAPVDFFGGALDDVRIYGRALSAAEIAADLRTPIAADGRAPDSESPRIELETPATGATVSEFVTIAASAADDVGVVGVAFSVDGQPIGAEVTAPPYWVTWDTRTVANGPHSLVAAARDTGGNVARSALRGVTVINPRPAAANRAPVVEAGGDLTVSAPGAALIDATVDDDGLPARPGGHARWSLVSGPDAVRFEPADAVRTTVRFTRPGTYVLRLTVSDGELSGSDDVTVTVTP